MRILKTTGVSLVYIVRLHHVIISHSPPSCWCYLRYRVSNLFVALIIVRGTSGCRNFCHFVSYIFYFFLVVIGVALSLWMWCLALFPLMDILPLYPLQHKQLLTGWQIWIWYLFRLPTWTDSGFLTWLNICNFLHFHIILSKQNCASQWRHFNHLNRKLKSTRHPQVPDGLAICHRYVYWLIVLMCIKI
jgi:hypothetical protein